MKRPKPTSTKVGNLTVVNRTGRATDPQELIDALNATLVELASRQPRGPRGPKRASAIEARSDATGTGAAEGESAVPNGETPDA